MTLDPRTLFRAVAIAEAVSWAGLLVGMYFKRIAETTDLGVLIFGPVHGIIVLAYVATVLYARRTFRWDVRVFLMAALSAVPPFASLFFEIWADRRALLTTAGSSKDTALIPS
jgi:integral membrane protein